MANNTGDAAPDTKAATNPNANSDANPDANLINQPETGTGIPGVNRGADISANAGTEQHGQLAPDGGGDEAARDGEQNAPGSYSEFSLPDGVQADTTMLGDFEAVANDLGLNQSQAQRLVDLQAKAAAHIAEQQNQYWVDQQSNWIADVRSDDEIGGSEMQQKISVAATAIERFGTPALKDALDSYGFGNHPELVRFAYRVGKSISQDSAFVASSGSGLGGAEKTLAQRIYPDQAT